MGRKMRNFPLKYHYRSMSPQSSFFLNNSSGAKYFTLKFHILLGIFITHVQSLASVRNSWNPVSLAGGVTRCFTDGSP